MQVNELFDAIRNGDAAAAASLIEAEPSLANSRQNGISPILFAVYNGHADVAQLFVEHGASPSFVETCALGDAESALRMLNADPSLLDSFSEDGFPSLGLAVFFRHPELARALIERGADVNAGQQLGYTALHTAAQLGDQVMLDLLLAAGADPRAAADDGKTPADLAAAHGHTAIAERLS